MKIMQGIYEIRGVGDFYLIDYTSEIKKDDAYSQTRLLKRYKNFAPVQNFISERLMEGKLIRSKFGIRLKNKPK